MKLSADFRSAAREALRRKWALAVIVGLVATLLCGGGAGGKGGLEINLDLDASGAIASLEFAGNTLFSTGSGYETAATAFFASSTALIILVALLMAAVYMVLGSVVEVGYARFNLELVDHKDAGFEHLFHYFYNWKTTTISRLLRSIYTLLWSLLFIIPGIIAAYSYAMTDYILAEHPGMTASEAIDTSREMMSGNRWRLFCLQFSFIGWSILVALTFGIGNLWLNPYRQAAEAAFYREISGTELAIYIDLPQAISFP